MKCYRGSVLVLCLVLAIFFASSLVAQETTGGLQGTVKDASGAVVPNAQITISGPSLVGAKTANSDASGYYHFANLPPGKYTITVTAQGFNTLKHEGQIIEVGHLPSIDLVLKVGGSEQVVEVTANAVSIDTTTTRTITNITQEVINDVPKGRSFQSVIQFAPAARNEPLAGQASVYSGPGGGGSIPGSNTSGNPVGYSVAGGADSENSYLVEGQETANIIGGYSNTNVPFEFIQEVQVKSSGVEAEHGGSLGGVVNVIMRKGGNDWHGQGYTYYETSGLDGSPNAFLRYDPNSGINQTTRQDAVAQLYQPKKDAFRIVNPGFQIGGPLAKDRLWFFAGFAPQYNSLDRQVDFGGSSGLQNFNRDTQTYYTTFRLDSALTQKIRVGASWLTGYQRQSGTNLPFADSTQGFVNTSTPPGPQAYTHGIGYSSPSSTFAVHGDVTVSPTLILTTRFGYTFQNYHDFGYPTQGDLFNFQLNGVGVDDAKGNPLPASLQQQQFATNLGYNANFTFRNASKHYQLDQDVAWFKSGLLGTHNFKFGYQLNHLDNNIQQLGNVPNVQIFPGGQYTPLSTVGALNCAQTSFPANCAGLYGYILVNDFGTAGQAANYNHGFFAQDAWTIGKGITLNLGLRVEKEYLPSAPTSGLEARPIDFGWGDKIAPRIGASWDVLRNGRLKVFGSYGVFNDVMKLNLAISSFGGQFWRQCVYALDPFQGQGSDYNLNHLNAAFVNGRSCPSGPVTTEANWAGGTTPDGLKFIENIDNRGTSNAAPDLKPYRQHESVFGVDYQLAKNYVFEARWDRRRLDHAIEDAAILNAATGAETFTNVNPGEGVNATFNGFSNFLYGASGPACDPSICKMVKAARSYDGLEIRLNRTGGQRWSGMFSYTYSKLRGNYDGLTSTDLADGFGGRNSPNNSRAFDEPYFQFSSHGTSSAGDLPTDRPNTFKGYAYLRQPWGHSQSTMFGLFQTAYEGTPQSSFVDVGAAGGNQPIFPVFIEGRGKFANVTQDPNTGAITLNSVGTLRTPWYTQSDASIVHEIKVNKNNEHQVLGLEMNVINLFNQRAVTKFYEGLNSLDSRSAVRPNGIGFGNPLGYQTFMSAYNWPAAFNTSGPQGGPMSLSSWYGKPFLFQTSRNVRFKVRFDF